MEAIEGDTAENTFGWATGRSSWTLWPLASYLDWPWRTPLWQAILSRICRSTSSTTLRWGLLRANRVNDDWRQHAERNAQMARRHNFAPERIWSPPMLRAALWSPRYERITLRRNGTPLWRCVSLPCRKRESASTLFRSELASLSRWSHPNWQPLRLCRCIHATTWLLNANLAHLKRYGRQTPKVLRRTFNFGVRHERPPLALVARREYLKLTTTFV